MCVDNIRYFIDCILAIGWFFTPEVAKSWPVSSVVNDGDDRGRVTIEIVLDAGKKVVDGTNYYLQAKFSDDWFELFFRIIL